MPTHPVTVHATPPHNTAKDLIQYITENRDGLEDALLRNGALKFRGFALHTAEDVEEVALALDPKLASGEYLGTSPRDALTRHVHSASELPGFYPIPQHCEMSFLANPPSRLYFACLLPSRWGGETPLCDFRLVWRDLDLDVRNRLERKGIRVVRNYAGPATRRSFDPSALKRWDAMFGTRDHQKIEEICGREGMTAEWLPDDKLRLTCEPSVMRLHPQTGEPVYFCHLQVFQVDTPEAELRRVRNLRRSAHARFWHTIGRLVTHANKRFKRPTERAMDVTHADGTPIASADVEHVRDVIWRHMVVEPWQLGDFVVIDNLSTSHGRLPYAGPRTVVVAWS